MYYINSLIIYSIVGFLLESTVYKINKSPRHSGICYGPITYVYGFGILNLILIQKHFLNKIQNHKYLKVIITFIVSWITLTLTEWLGGTILYHIFHINMWNYSKKSYHFGKYICLELSLIWGILGTIYLYYIKDFIDKFIQHIPKKLTIAIIILQAIDITLVLINKLP